MLNTSAIRVLFVDDEALTCKYFAKSVMDDYEVAIAHDVKTALRLLRESRIDILVADYRMPGVNGDKLLKVVSQEFPNTICIMATAYADKDVLLDTVNAARLFHILEKPVNRETLKNVLSQATEQMQRNPVIAPVSETSIDPSLAYQLSSLLVYIIDLSVSMQHRIQADSLSNQVLSRQHQSLLENITAIRQNAEYAYQMITMSTPSSSDPQ